MNTEPHRYSADLAAEIESRWQDEWERLETFNAANPTGALGGPVELTRRPKAFIMDMFPYPSGVGLHVGHPLGYIATDVFARYRRMTGYNVLHTLGYDAFGLPAEQYAVQTGMHPRVTTEANIVNMRRQRRRLGLGQDDRRSIATIDPSFYKWTQWIFLQIFNSWYDTEARTARPIAELVEEFAAGTRQTPGGRAWAELSGSERATILNDYRLAYPSTAPVNWCPGLGTVLANEEVTADGRSERGNFPVFKAELRQWMMRITAYADRLVDDLDLLDWPEAIKLQQRHWIGRSSGARVHFPLLGTTEHITVFTTRPDTLFGATYVVLAPEHPLVDLITMLSWPEGVNTDWTGGMPTPAQAVNDYRAHTQSRSDLERQSDTRAKTGVFTGGYAVNPANGQPLPVFIADYVLPGYGTGAIMAVPGQDERDYEFAQAYGLPIVRTVQPPAEFDGGAYTGEGVAINSANTELDLNGLDIAQAKQSMTSWLEEEGYGEQATSFKLRDWLFSRQRYWGEPFPIVYDEEGTPHALPESMLPVELPDVDDYRPRTFEPDERDSQPETPLSRRVDWVEVTLDLGDGPRKYRRETNTMPNWAGSCCYELRYVDPDNDRQLVDPELERYWMGPTAERPSGGVDLYVGGAEHAVLHLLYSRFWHKVMYDLGHVSSLEPFYKLYNQGMIQAYVYRDSRGFPVPAAEVTEANGEYFFQSKQVTRALGKMGKSLNNAVTPDEICAEYSADTLRLYEMAMGPLDVSRPWETQAVVGSFRFLQRLWRNLVSEETGEPTVVDEAPDRKTLRLLHKTIESVGADLEDLRFNTAIAKLIEFNNHLTRLSAPVPVEVARTMTLLVAPLAPHIAEELWQRLGHATSLAYEPFPSADPELAKDESVVCVVQVRAKVRARMDVPADITEGELEALALNHESVRAELNGSGVRKVIVRAPFLVNIVPE